MKKSLYQGARWLFRFRVYGMFFVAIIFLAFFGINIASIFIKEGFGNFLLLITTVLISSILVLIILGEIYARMAYNRWFYEIGKDNIRLERGIIWKRYSNIPYERVQNVDINRGIIARIFGFSSIMIQTAGYSVPIRGYGASAEGHIPALGVKEAEEVREYVLKRINGKNQGL